MRRPYSLRRLVRRCFNQRPLEGAERRKTRGAWRTHPGRLVKPPDYIEIISLLAQFSNERTIAQGINAVTAAGGGRARHRGGDAKGGSLAVKPAAGRPATQSLSEGMVGLSLASRCPL